MHMYQMYHYIFTPVGKGGRGKRFHMYPLLLSKGGVGVRGVSCVPSSPLKPRTIKVEISNEH